jgi:hypothetical protein
VPSEAIGDLKSNLTAHSEFNFSSHTADLVDHSASVLASVRRLDVGDGENRARVARAFAREQGPSKTRPLNGGSGSAGGITKEFNALSCIHSHVSTCPRWIQGWRHWKKKILKDETLNYEINNLTKP